MEEKEFNLLRNPWIRVIGRDMKVKEVSLTELFSNAHEYIMLAGETAPQNTAMLRMLIAIAITVLYRYSQDGSEDSIEEGDEDEATLRWQDYWDAKRFNSHCFSSYLKKHEDQFWLFHPKTPFYQVPDLKYGTDYEIKCILGNVKESNNIKTKPLFMTCSQKNMTQISYSEAARWLVYQMGYCPSTKPVKGDKDWSGGKCGTGRLGKLGLIYIDGNNLFETIMLNLVALREDGTVWDAPKPAWERETACSTQCREIARPGNLPELYTIQSRRIQLKKENGRVVGYKCLQGDYFPLENDFTEPMSLRFVKKVKKAGTETVYPKRFGASLGSWQEFPSMFGAEEDSRIPGIVLWSRSLYVKGMIHEGRRLTFHTTSIIYDSKASIIEGYVDDHMTLSADILGTVGKEWINEISNQVKKCKTIADFYLKEFADNIETTILKRTKKTDSEKLKINFYSKIDVAFRAWLLNIDPTEKEKEKTILEWEKKAARIAREVATDYVKTLSMYLTRIVDVDGRYYSIPGYLNIYMFFINKTYIPAIESKNNGGSNEQRK